MKSERSVKESVKNSFPYISQIISDAFRTDAYYFAPPYPDLYKIDKGFRRLIWNKNDQAEMLQQAADIMKGCHLAVIKSTLDFYNVVAFVPNGEKVDFIVLGPFGEREFSENDINHIMRKNRMPAAQMAMIRQFYHSLPVVETSRLLVLFQHLLTPYLPEFETVVPEYVNYSEVKHSFEPGEGNTQFSLYDRAEQYKSCLNTFLNSILSGNGVTAAESLKQLLDETGYHAGMGLRTMKKVLNRLNVHCCSRLLQTQIHPSYVLEQFDRFEVQIENSTNTGSLFALPNEMSRKYTLLIKNHSLSEYTCLIRNIMNYISLHISEEMTLSVIAEYFQKNPSYISGRFRQETGQSLTEYIQKERMQAAIRFFNTTNMSVAETAASVGIQDFGYFAKLFKKHIGCTPSQYQKLVQH